MESSVDDTVLKELLARKESIEASIHSIEFWLLVFGVLVVIGVGGESVYGIRSWRNSRNLRELQKRIDVETEARAKAQSDAMEQENLKLQKQVLELREKLADRRLTPEQKAVVSKKLATFSGTKITFFVYSGDPEIFGIAQDIIDALAKPAPTGASWIVTSEPGQELNRAVKGILIEYKEGADAREIAAATSLAEVLVANHLLISGPA